RVKAAIWTDEIGTSKLYCGVVPAVCQGLRHHEQSSSWASHDARAGEDAVRSGRAKWKQLRLRGKATHRILRHADETTGGSERFRGILRAALQRLREFHRRPELGYRWWYNPRDVLVLRSSFDKRTA